MGLGYANSSLYVFSRGWHSLARVAVYALTTIPITSTSTTIPNRIYTTVNATAAVQSCGGMGYYQSFNLGKDLVFNCWVLKNGKIFTRHDGKDMDHGHTLKNPKKRLICFANEHTFINNYKKIRTRTRNRPISSTTTESASAN